MRILTALLSGMLLCSCASTTLNTQGKVILEQEAWVSLGGAEPGKRPAGTELTIDGDPVLLEKPGHVGVLVLPAGDTPAAVKVSLKPISQWGGEHAERYLNRMLSRLLTRITEVQRMLAQGKGESALAEVRTMRSEFPKVSYLSLLEVSCLVVLGRTTEAKALLAAALEEFPEEPEAQQLFRSLAGRLN